VAPRRVLPSYRSMALIFEWHSAKAASNLRKHRISFEEASTVFADPMARVFDAPAHSDVEPRELIIGHSSLRRLLVVSFTERPTAVRLITARRASKRERTDYEKGNATHL
jgi:uncharacterized DUF497 family protein